MSMHIASYRNPCCTHLLVIPPPGGSPGMFSDDRNFITWNRSRSSFLDLIT